jgi:excisionase family DNA binding protein
MDNQDIWVSAKKLSQMMDIPERTIRNWVYRREIPFHRIRRLVRFNLREIKNWTENTKVAMEV